jgi:hypothetical protein
MKKILLASAFIFAWLPSYAVTKIAVTMYDGSLQASTTGFHVSSGTVVNLNSTSLDVATITVSSVVNANGHKVVNLSTATSSSDGVNLGQVPFVNTSTATRFQTVATASGTTALVYVPTLYNLTYKLSDKNNRVMGVVSIPCVMGGTVVNTAGSISYTRDGVDQTSGGLGFITAATLAVNGQSDGGQCAGFFIDNPGDTNFHNYRLTFKSTSTSDTFTLNGSNFQGSWYLTEFRPNP